jgi:hypothetical protein
MGKPLPGGSEHWMPKNAAGNVPQAMLLGTALVRLL